MNKRALTKALKDWSGPNHGQGSVARTVAAQFAHADRVPKRLREPLHSLAMACLACETAESAPAGTPSYPELYRSREKAFEAFADAVAPRKPASASSDVLYPPTNLPCDAEGIMYHDRVREPEEP